MWIKYLLVVCLAYNSLVESSVVPFITKCKVDDTKCIKESSQKVIPIFAAGIPELNVETLDPMFIKHIDASTPNLKLIVSDSTLTGLKNCEAKKVERDVAKSKLFITVVCSCDLVGQYVMKGQLFVLPIEGNGEVRTKIPKMVIHVEGDLTDKVGKDGKKHWHIKSWKHSFELKEKSVVKFENLFPDNEFLRKTTNELIESNGNDVVTEIGGPVIKAFLSKVIVNTQKLFSAAPEEDLVLY